MSSLLDDLLPGIPDDVTLNHIVTKLPWAACQSLFAVSLRWQQAIENRKVYDARIRHLSTETLVVVKHQDCNDRTTISLYSMQEKASYQLPPIPHLESGIPRLVHFISSDGKLYILGDVMKEDRPTDGTNDKQKKIIHVLDLAGQRQWKQCAGIPGPLLHKNFSIGSGLLVARHACDHGRNAECSKYAWSDSDDDVHRMVSPSQSLALDVRNTVLWLMKQGNLYWLRPRHVFASIYFSNVRTSSRKRPWSELEYSTRGCEQLGPTDSIERSTVVFAFPVGDELLAIAGAMVMLKQRHRPRISRFAYRYRLLQSKMFRAASLAEAGELRKVVWENGPDWFHFAEFSSILMCAIEL